MKRIICVFMGVLALSIALISSFGGKENKSYIKYVEFNVTREALASAVELDKSSEGKLDCVTSLAYLGAKYGGDFKKYKPAHLQALSSKLDSGESIDDITKDMRYYKYYLEAYGAVLGGITGKYEEERLDGEKKVSEQKYGVRWFSPIAKTFPYSSYDDFGAVRTYGYTRPHLGHDMMAAVGTPVVAVESGTVETLGWNKYGGWRVGIRSFDKKRYWYYAHLRQNRPFAEGLTEGDTIKAGDVIGYVGRTGYSNTENTNGITESHLHIGLELVFDESQKESDNEIWVDITAITELLECHQSAVERNSETKEFTRIFSFNEINN